LLGRCEMGVRQRPGRRGGREDHQRPPWSPSARPGVHEMTEPISGKTVLSTGATSGIGLEASAKLAGMGAEVVLVGRDRARGEAAVAAVKRRSGSRAVVLMRCDFASLTQIRALAANVVATRPKLHILVNNAGSVSARRGLTEDGIERTL